MKFVADSFLHINSSISLPTVRFYIDACLLHYKWKLSWEGEKEEDAKIAYDFLHMTNEETIFDTLNYYLREFLLIYPLFRSA